MKNISITTKLSYSLLSCFNLLDIFHLNLKLVYLKGTTAQILIYLGMALPIKEYY